MSSLCQVAVKIRKVRNENVFHKMLIMLEVEVSIIVILENVVLLYENLKVTRGLVLLLVRINELSDRFKSMSR
jgi:hypothetical protein